MIWDNGANSAGRGCSWSCRTLYAEDEIEAAAMEQARAKARELRQLADATPDGHVLAVVERATV